VIRVYEILVLPIQPFSCTPVRHGQYSRPTNEAWTLEAFHMKCQLRSPNIQDPLIGRTTSVTLRIAARTGLGLVSDLIKRRRNSVFGHIAKFSEDIPAHQAFRCHVDLTLSHSPEHSWNWKRHPAIHVVRTTDGSTSSAATTIIHHQLTCGEDSPRVVIRE